VIRTSLSGQFVVEGTPFMNAPAIGPIGDREFLILDPATTVVSCERIKLALLRELRIRDEWRGKIHLRLHPRPLGSPEESSRLTMVPHPEGWLYYLDLPEQMSRRRFLTSLVLVMVQEIVNRGARDTPVEFAPWLGEGLAAHLESMGRGDLMVDPLTRGTEDHRRDTSHAALRERLAMKPVLSLDALNWPAPGMDESQRQHYRDCAELLVWELLRVDHGSEQMAQMLRDSVHHLNWQSSFVAAFHSLFSRLGEAEKWWAVASANFLGRETSGDLASGDTLRQLAEIVSIPVSVRSSETGRTNDTRITLQAALMDWEAAQLDPVLNRRIAMLQALEWRCNPRTASLVRAYRSLLSSYLDQRNAAGTAPTRREALHPNARIALKRTLHELNDLDRARQRLQAEEAALAESRKPLPPRPGGTSGAAAAAR
jgi:hypothetical protein